MKVTQTRARDCKRRNQTAEITIKLDDIEAGWLRANVVKLSGWSNGFIMDLAEMMRKLVLPEYEKRYPGWQKGEVPMSKEAV